MEYLQRFYGTTIDRQTQDPMSRETSASQPHCESARSAVLFSTALYSMRVNILTGSMKLT
jgi:hypothetical protein